MRCIIAIHTQVKPEARPPTESAMNFTITFISAPLPFTTVRQPIQHHPRQRRIRPNRVHPLCEQARGRDQFGQYAARDVARLKQQLQRVNENRSREYHYQIFLNQGSANAFFPAAQRFTTSLSTSPKWSSPAEALCVLTSTADPTFGSLRGEPFPKRVSILHHPLQPSQPDSNAPHDHPLFTWLNALNRAGPALSLITSHVVEYATWGECNLSASSEPYKTLQPTQLVATEIINADWTDADTVPAMRACMLNHASRSTTEGNAQLFRVLQSVTEPTCFKTVEVYNSLQHLHDQMKRIDPQFDKEVKPFRAAVNRVRQLYQVVHAV